MSFDDYECSSLDSFLAKRNNHYLKSLYIEPLNEKYQSQILEINHKLLTNLIESNKENLEINEHYNINFEKDSDFDVGTSVDKSIALSCPHLKNKISIVDICKSEYKNENNINEEEFKNEEELAINIDNTIAQKKNTKIKKKNFTSAEKSTTIQNRTKLLEKKRGRKIKNSKEERIHSKFAMDNIMIKIKNKCDNCIVAYLNECIKCSKKYNKQKFLKFDRKSKIKTIANYLQSIKEKQLNLRDIVIHTKISSKYGHKKGKKGKKENENENTNKKIFQYFEEDETLKNIFSEEYFHFFKNVFYKNKREIKIKITENKYETIKLSKKVEMFFDLLEEKDNDIKYKQQVVNCASKYFMPDSKFKLNYY